MERKWYILYVKNDTEIKVSHIINKKGIFSYVPLKNRILDNDKKRKTIKEIIFKNYVFVYTSIEKLFKLKELNNVINIIYWLNNPVTIKADEVETLSNFIDIYNGIVTERNVVEPGKNAEIIIESVKENNEDISTLNTLRIKAILPSLGFTLITYCYTNLIESEKIISNSYSDLINDFFNAKSKLLM